MHDGCIKKYLAVIGCLSLNKNTVTMAAPTHLTSGHNFVDVNIYRALYCLYLLLSLLQLSNGQFKYDGNYFRNCTINQQHRSTCWQSSVPLKESVACKPLNTKERRIFFNYHITHHAGTNLFMMADRAHIPWDGSNGNYNPPPGAKEATFSKDDMMKRWMSNVSYSIHQNKRLLPTDMKSWSDRRNELNLEVTLSLPRRYVAIESPLINIWNYVPIEDPRVNSMIVMRNPITRLLKFIDHYFVRANNATDLPRILGMTNPDFLGKHLGYLFNRYQSYSIKWLGGANLDVFVEDEALFNRTVDRLKMFDHVIIMEAMDETTQFLCCEWGWKFCDSLIMGSGGRYESVYKLFNNTALFLKIIESNTMELKLYDKAIEIAKQQMRQMNLRSPNLDKLPTDSKQALLEEMQKHNTVHKYWRNRDAL